MISIKKDFENPPELLVKSKRDVHIKDALITKNEHSFRSSIYRKTTIEALEKLYNHKCAYCETDISAGAPFQVEHFRPKAKTEGDLIHKGYYWLAYEWSNLTLGCSICNNSKKNYFPIVGTRIYDPLIGSDGLPTSEYLRLKSELLLGELATLLNPEIDEVEKHFYFLPNGEIKDLGERAKATIEILKLNRKRLMFWRRKVWKDYSNDLKDTLKDFLENSISEITCRTEVRRIFKKILLQQDPKKQYSRFGYFMYYKFEFFVANDFEGKQKDAVLRFFELFKNGKL